MGRRKEEGGSGVEVAAHRRASNESEFEEKVEEDAFEADIQVGEECDDQLLLANKRQQK